MSGRGAGGRFGYTEFGENAVGGFGAGAHAVGYADPAVPVAGKRESGKLLAKGFDSLQPFKMPHAILRHCALPLIDPRKERLGSKPENLLQFILRAPVVTAEVLCASIAAYLMLGLTWSAAYWLVDQVTPGGAFSFNTNGGGQSMNGFNGIYFSFITLSTVGYGDITPVSRAARWLAAMEAMTGLLYVAVLIARLVSLYSKANSNES